MSFICKLSGQPNFFSNNPKGLINGMNYINYIKINLNQIFGLGNQPENEGHVQDYQDLVPEINYSKFLKTLKIFEKKDKKFFDFFYVYLEASKELASNLLKKNPLNINTEYLVLV